MGSAENRTDNADWHFQTALRLRCLEICLEQFLLSRRKFRWKNSKTVDFNRKRSISIEETSKGWMFFIGNDTKFFMKLECFVTRCFTMMHPYKRAIGDVLSLKNVFSTVDPSCNELWRGHWILFYIVTVRKWVKKIRKLRFSQFCIFFLYRVSFPTDPNRLSL